jgi:hypothetical protein
MMNPETQNPKPKISLKLGSVLLIAFSFVASLYAGVLNERSLWGDEWLRIAAQSLKVSHLLEGIHIRAFDTQSTFAYLVQRPFSLWLGLDTGGLFSSAVFGACGIAALVFTTRLAFGRRVAWIALLLLATNPLHLYYASEIGFYGYWEAATVLHVGLVILFLQDPARIENPRYMALFFLGTLGTIGFHFYGVLIGGLSFLVFVWFFRKTQPSFNDPRGYALWTRVVGLWAIPFACLFPLYIQAYRSVEHISKETDWSKWPSAIVGTLQYLIVNLPSETGGGILGLGLLGFVAGLIVLFQRHRKVFVLLMTIIVLPMFVVMVQNHLRGYHTSGTRYWIYALGPVTMVIAVGFATLIEHPRWRTLSKCAFIGLLALNIFASVLVANQLGRAIPYREVVHWVRESWLPQSISEAIMITPNHYQRRFIGNYYSVPEGRVHAPVTYEEGRDMRIAGVREVFRLLPNAMVFFPDGASDAEVQEAGVQLQRREIWRLNAAERWAQKLRLHPELGYYGSYEATVGYSLPVDFENQAKVQHKPQILPSRNLYPQRFVYFTDEPEYVLIHAPHEVSEFRIYSPQEKEVEFRCELFVMPQSQLVLQLNEGKALRPLSPKVIVPPSNRIITDTPFVRGAVQMLGLKLRAGWNTLSLRTQNSTHCLILNYSCQ